MIIAGRWITFLIWAPHVFVYRRWGWSGIVLGWTSLAVVGALSQWLGDGDTSKGQIQMVVVGAVIITFLLFRLLTAGQGPETAGRVDDITGQGVFGAGLVRPARQATPALETLEETAAQDGELAARAIDYAARYGRTHRVPGRAVAGAFYEALKRGG